MRAFNRKRHWYKRILPVVAVLIFSGIAAVLLIRSEAAGEATVNVNFAATPTVNPDWIHYEDSHIRIQRNGGTADANLLSALNTESERAFVILDKWIPTTTELNGTMKSGYQARYAINDTSLADMKARGVAPWITQEVDAWKDKDATTNWSLMKPSPLDNTELNRYEDALYKIVKYIKQKNPQTKIVESMNEMNMNKFGLSFDDQVNLYVRNAKVVSRLNTDLGLTGSNKLISGGPSFIKTAFTGTAPHYEKWLRAIYNHPDFAQIKPAFFSFHTFNTTNRPYEYRNVANTVRAFMNKAEFGGAWDNVPIWVTAYGLIDDGAPDKNLSDPAPAGLARAAAGFAAIHKSFLDGGVKDASMFAQSNYRNYEESLLLAEEQSGKHRISYYAPGKKTPLYNVFSMMSKMDGKRAVVTASGAGVVNSDGIGLAAEGVRGTNRAWVMAWNYQNDASTGMDRTVTFNISGLSSAGIANTQAATAKLYMVDNTTSNIGHGTHSNDGLQLIGTVSLPAGATRNFTRDVTTNGTLFVEITPSGTIPNSAPTVSAGPDKTIALSAAADLDGSASDDGLPNGTLHRTWSKVSGPGTVTFTNASAASTSATFSAPGSYVLRLTATDDQLISTDDTTITVITVATRYDLVVTSITTSPSSVTEGDEVTFRATVQNAGDAPTPAGIKHGVAFMVNGSVASWSDTHMSSIAPGASVTLTANGGPDANATWLASEGSHTIIAEVDRQNNLDDEANEANNTRSITLSVAGDAVDNDKPLASLSYPNLPVVPEDNEIIVDAPFVTTRVEASDPGSGVASVQGYVNDVPAVITDNEFSTPDANGNYIVRVVVRDNAGNETVVTKSFYVRYPDFDRSGKVNIVDIAALMQHYMQVSNIYDFDDVFAGTGNNLVDAQDLFFLMRYWPSPEEPSPEE